MLKALIAENLYKWETQSLAPPAQISITPTNFCNLKCHSCWQRDGAHHSKSPSNPTEIPEQKLCDIIRQASELGVRCVELTGGGEPLARKSATAQLIKEIKNRSMIGWMTSNGTLFTPDIIKLMIELGWDKLTFSLDGPDAKTNDFLRPPSGSFEKVINALGLFNEYKKLLNKDIPEITFNVVVSKYNIDKLSEIIYLASRHAVRGVTFEPIKILSSECKGLLVDFEEEYGRIMKELERAQLSASKNNIFTNIDGLMRTPELIKYSGKLLSGMPAKTFNGKESKLLNVPCIEPWFHIYLEADGNVRPCCVNPGFGENIHNKSLRDIWFGEEFSSFRNAIISRNYPLSCNQCNANLICFSREIQELLKENFSFPGHSDNEKKAKGYQKQRQIKMLITDTAPLYPPLWGGPKRIWNLFTNFNRDKFDISYVGVHCNLGGDLKYSFKKLGENFREILCKFPAHYYFWHNFEKIFFKNTSLDLFTYLFMHTDWHFKHILNSQNADIVICSHPWGSLSYKKKSGQFAIYDAHNCEYLLMDQILGRHKLKSLILQQVKRIEGDACRKSDLILVCSEREKQDIEILYGVDRKKFIIVPNGTSLVEQTNNMTKQKCRFDIGISESDRIILFIGAYYKPNNEAAIYIVNNLAPALRDFKFILIGTVGKLFENADVPANVKILGQLSDKDFKSVMRTADIAINPMFKGSGINIKMLDYMSYGLPIVTTQCGARGIQTNGKAPMLVSSLERFCQDIKMLFENRALQIEMSEAGRQLVREQYDWQRISANLQETILQRMKEKT